MYARTVLIVLTIQSALCKAVSVLIQYHSTKEYGEAELQFHSFSVNRAITDWNKLPEGAIGTSHGKTHIFKTRVRKVKSSEGK
jgi:hypothetical protein